MTISTLFKPSTLLCCMALASTSHAAEIYKDDQKQLDFDLVSWVGAFSSQKNYLPKEKKGGSQWTEGFVKYGFSGSVNTGTGSTIYGAVAGVTSFVRGDGDLGGNTIGNENKTTFEDAYIGWQSGNLIPVLGENGLDISFGQQVYHLGDGFLVTDDSANLGNAGGEDSSVNKVLNRGGGYYTAPRRAFHNAAVVKIGQTEGLKAELAWIQSDNGIQASSEFATADLTYKKGPNILGFDYIKFLDIDKSEAVFNPGNFTRENMKVYSIRGATNATVENLTLNFNYSRQEKEKFLTDTYDVIDKDHDDNAWYAGISYNFVQAPWTPTVGYRYTHYSENWNPMFVGIEKLGTWIPGEVAGNFAGPFNTNSNIHMISVEAFPSEKLLLGANLYQIDTAEKSPALNLSAKELDLFAMYQVNEALAVIPVLAIYKPEKSAGNGGSQIGSTDTNVFAGIILSVTY
jgi:hypothetical protein